MRINPINYTPINIYKKTVTQNPIYTQNQVSFNGLGDFVTFQRDKIRAKREANKIKARGMEILESSKNILNHANNILKNSSEITHKASKLDRKAYVLLVEMQSVLEILGNNDGELGDYRITSQINNGKVERVIEKYNKDNLTLSKKAIISPDEIRLYDYKAKNKIDTYYLNGKTRKLTKAFIGTQYSPVGLKADEKYVFSRYGLASYSKGYSTAYKKSEMAQERYIFGKYGLKTFMHGYENQFKTMLIAKNRYDFENETLQEYTQDLREINKIAQSSTRKCYFDNSVLYFYKAGNESIKNKSEFSKETFEFSEEHGVSTASVNYSFKEGNTSYAKLITCNSRTGKVKEFYEELKIAPRGENQPWWDDSKKTYKAKYEF